MANCMWEFLVIWNRDPEVTYALEQAIVYLRYVQNAVLQHGNAVTALTVTDCGVWSHNHTHTCRVK